MLSLIHLNADRKSAQKKLSVRVSSVGNYEQSEDIISSKPEKSSVRTLIEEFRR